MPLPESLDFPKLIGGFSFFFLIALLPFAVILMTSFTRISIVLTFLKQALNASAPSGHLIIALSLLLTGYVMHPVFESVYKEAALPFIEGKEKDVSTLMKTAWVPLRNFMTVHTREKDLSLFYEMGNIPFPYDSSSLDEIPWFCLIPAFVLSELRIAFQMGFLLFLPFLIIDLVVSSILMSLGMVMLPPTVISFPFKILLFVIVDGWRLVVQQIAGTY